jgi:hypothetical protein
MYHCTWSTWLPEVTSRDPEGVSLRRVRACTTGSYTISTPSGAFSLEVTSSNGTWPQRGSLGKVRTCATGSCAIFALSHVDHVQWYILYYYNSKKIAREPVTHAHAITSGQGRFWWRLFLSCAMVRSSLMILPEYGFVRPDILLIVVCNTYCVWFYKEYQRTIKDGQSRETGNIVYTRQKINKTKKTKHNMCCTPL